MVCLVHTGRYTHLHIPGWYSLHVSHNPTYTRVVYSLHIPHILHIPGWCIACILLLLSYTRVYSLHVSSLSHIPGWCICLYASLLPGTMVGMSVYPPYYPVPWWVGLYALIAPSTHTGRPLCAS